MRRTVPCIGADDLLPVNFRIQGKVAEVILLGKALASCVIESYYMH